MDDTITRRRRAHVLAYEQHRLDRSDGFGAFLALAQGEAMRHIMALEPALQRMLAGDQFGTRPGDWDRPEFQRYLALIKTTMQLAQLELEPRTEV
jgi:hypothetical protein